MAKAFSGRSSARWRLPRFLVGPLRSLFAVVSVLGACVVARAQVPADRPPLIDEKSHRGWRYASTRTHIDLAVKDPTDRLKHKLQLDNGTRAKLSLIGHESQVLSAAWSPDDATLLSGGTDRTARLWNTATGKELFVFPDHPAVVRNTAFTPDGKLLLTGAGCSSRRQLRRTLGFGVAGGEATGDPGGVTLCVWSTAGRKKLHEFTAESPILYTWFAPDGKLLYVTDTNKQITTWDMKTGEKRLSWAIPSHLCDAVFTPNGKTLYTASSTDNIVRRWDTATGAAKGEIVMAGLKNIESVHASATGKHVLAFGQFRIKSNADAIPDPLRLVIGGLSMGVSELANASTWELDHLCAIHDAATGLAVFQGQIRDAPLPRFQFDLRKMYERR